MPASASTANRHGDLADRLLAEKMAENHCVLKNTLLFLPKFTAAWKRQPPDKISNNLRRKRFAA